jgi:hypothetical protein
MGSANFVDLLYSSRSKRDSNLHVTGDLLTDVLQPTVITTDRSQSSRRIPRAVQLESPQISMRRRRGGAYLRLWLTVSDVASHC